MAAWLQKQWYRSTVWQFVLAPFSWLFGLIVALRRLAYRIGVFKADSLPVPVIVVGNISVGGTGKTPLVIWLAQQLQAAGFSPGIISRGYGGSSERPVSVSLGSDPVIAGDEPVLIANRTHLPVWVCRDRVAAGQALLNANPRCDVIISDDGLQHYRLHRDIEIVVIDGQRGFGNGRLLPAGPLREPVSRLQEVDAVVSHGGSEDARTFRMELHAKAFYQVSDPTLTVNADALRGKRLLAIAGIGNPERFFAQLRQMGLKPQTRAFPDHHAYRAEDFQDLQTAGIDAILMTEKDAVKCRSFAEAHWWYLQVNAEVRDGLLDRILAKLRK